MINEAVFALHEGVATKEAIDEIMKLGMNHPMGPLALADFIGLDVCLAILNVLHEGLGDPKYRPCPLLRRMVDAGHLGRKSGAGLLRTRTEPPGRLRQPGEFLRDPERGAVDVPVPLSAFTPLVRSHSASDSSAINAGMRIAGKSRFETGGDSKSAKLLMT